MWHLILTASNNNRSASVHITLREVFEDGSERTVAVRGGCMPMITGGLFDDDPGEVLTIVERALSSFRTQLPDTHQ